MASSAFHAMRHRIYSGRWLALHAGESEVCCGDALVHNSMLTGPLRWLIDTDKDAAGMAVIVDLHGGDPEDPNAKAEFREIKDRVIFEVSLNKECSVGH